MWSDRVRIGLWIRSLVVLCLISANTTLAQTPVVRFTVDEYKIEGENPLSNAQTSEALELYTGEIEGIEGVFAATESLQAALRKNGFDFYQVFVPPQTLTDGIVTIRVVPVKIGAVEVKGNKHFTADDVKNALPSIAPGKTPDIKQFSRELALANKHPSRFFAISLNPSSETGKTDALIEVSDRKPWQLLLSLDNSGSGATGKYRSSVSARYDALWGLGHGIAASYSTSPENPQDLKQYGLAYRAPIPAWTAEANLSFSSSDVDSGTIGDLFDVTGSGTVLGLDVTQYLGGSGGYKHQWHIGFQDKLFENNLSFLGQPLGSKVRSRPFVLGYAGQYTRSGTGFSFYIDYLRNVPGGSDSGAAEYAAARPGASRHWDALKAGVSYTRAIAKDYELRLIADGQLANEPLIPSEKFGLGGRASIRGFEERQFSGDSGLRATAELWTPLFKSDRSLQGLAFADWGYRSDKNVAAGSVGSDSMLGVGVGIRWVPHPSASVSIDYATSLERARTVVTESSVSGSRLHASLTVQF